MSLAHIPDEDLFNDLAETVSDIKLCHLAQLHQIKDYSGGTVLDRLQANLRIKETILSEIDRRNLEVPAWIDL